MKNDTPEVIYKFIKHSLNFVKVLIKNALPILIQLTNRAKNTFTNYHLPSIGFIAISILIMRIAYSHFGLFTIFFSAIGLGVYECLIPHCRKIFDTQKHNHAVPEFICGALCCTPILLMSFVKSKPNGNMLAAFVIFTCCLYIAIDVKISNLLRADGAKSNKQQSSIVVMAIKGFIFFIGIFCILIPINKQSKSFSSHNHYHYSALFAATMTLCMVISNFFVKEFTKRNKVCAKPIYKYSIICFTLMLFSALCVNIFI